MIWAEESKGQRIKRLRLERDWTQDDLCLKTGLSWQTINRIETDVTRVLLEYLERFAKAFGVTVEYLQSGDTHSERETTRLVDEMLRAGRCTADEADELKSSALQMLKTRRNGKIPLRQNEIEMLMQIMRGS